MDSAFIQQVIGDTFIVLGLIFAAFGVYAVLKLDRFYSRLVITSKVETMAFITILIGAIVLTGFSFFAIKIAIIILFEILTLPVGSHAVARSAYVNGFRAQTVTPTELTMPSATSDGPESEGDDENA